MNSRTNERHDAQRNVRPTSYQPGYAPVLVREELKQKARQWRIANNFTDSHIERCLLSACVELAMRPENAAALFELLESAIAKDFKLSLPNGSELRHHAPA